MTVISLHKIVTNVLLKRKYPWHYYIEFLVYAKDGLATLAKDENIISGRYKVLQLNDNHAIEIPNDYLDYTKISMMNGQHLQPLVEDNSLNLVPNYDSDFQIQPYSQGFATDTATVEYAGYLSPYWWTVNWNSYGENTGRQFGGVGSMSDTFRVNKARNEIKINENLTLTQVVLEYVSNGMDADSATQIDWYAKDCLEAYCMWQFKENNRTYSAGEAEVAKQEYINQRLILRAELSDLTTDNLKRIVQRNSIAVKY
jgi:hypothetical protein